MVSRIFTRSQGSTSPLSSVSFCSCSGTRTFCPSTHLALWHSDLLFLPSNEFVKLSLAARLCLASARGQCQMLRLYQRPPARGDLVHCCNFRLSLNDDCKINLPTQRQFSSPGQAHELHAKIVLCSRRAHTKAQVQLSLEKDSMRMR